MSRIARLLAAFVILLGLMPCAVREAVAGELVAACCAHEDAADAHDDAPDEDAPDEDAPDCCDGLACVCAAQALRLAPAALLLPPCGFLLVDAPTHIDRPNTRAGPPPTPPPIA